MEIVFVDERLRRDCTQARWMQRAHGAARSQIIGRRLDQLRAADNLGHFRLAFHRRCHELTVDRKGQLSVDLDGGHRLLIEPANDPVPKNPDGGLQWLRITAIRVMAVENPHG